MRMVISNANMSAATRASIARLQSELTRAQDELSSGRRSQLGLVLGARSISATVLRARIDESQAFLDTNKVVSARFDAAQSALGSLSDLAQGMQAEFLAAISGASNPTTLVANAMAALSQTMSLMNSNFDGVSLFGGLGIGNPLKEVSANGAPAVAAAFQAKFGIAPGDAASAGIASSDMQDFLDAEFAALFDNDVNWSSLWSNATNDVPQTRISQAVTVPNSVSANIPAVRNLVKSLTMVAALGIESLSPDTRSALIAQASSQIGGAQTMLTDTIAQVGVLQNRLQDANNELSLQHAQLGSRLDDIEVAHLAELSTRISTLSMQLQASYQVTSKLSQLSLINFI